MTDRLAGRRVLVTGASGFIGRHLATALRLQGADVEGVSRNGRSTGPEGVRWWRADLTDLRQVRKLLTSRRPDYLFHLSSLVDGRRDRELVVPTFESEALTTVYLLSAAAETSIRRVILPGSLEEALPGDAPSSPYAAAKAVSRSYAQLFHALYQFPVVLTRIFMVYGPAQPLRKLIPYAARCFLSGETPMIASPERQVDWIYVSDVVEGLIATLEGRDLEGQSIDIGTGSMVTIRYVVERLRDLIMPGAAIDFDGPGPRSNEQVRGADTERTRRQIGWSARVSLDEGLRHTVAWLRGVGAQ